MADPPPKKVFSIFQARPKPTATPSQISPPSSSNSSEPLPQHASTDSTTASEPEATTQKVSSARAVERTASKDSECITIESDDDEEAGSSSTLQGSTKGSSKTSRATRKAGKGKGKAKEISVDSDEEDCVVVKGSTPRKKTKKKGTLASNGTKNDKGKKGNKTIKELESIDLTESPPRKPSASSNFAPLSTVYRQEREARRLANEGNEPRWPTAEEHGNYLSTNRPSSTQIEPRQRRYPGSQQRTEMDKGKGKETDGDSFFTHFGRSLESAQLPSPRVFSHKDLPIASTSTLIPTYPSHPLLDRIASSLNSNSFPSNQNSELWTTKYGPKKADEVLGDLSGNSALLLKEWLTELKVAGGIEDENSKKRRRPVNRGIDKKKKKKRRKDDLDDFLASSSGEEDEHIPFNTSMFDDLEDPEDEDDDLSAYRTAAAPLSSSTTFHRLTNLILLVGPNGSGKTASVQAVAQELGYEIFEVNAGMGKRRAKDLESEVGDVGRNHIVRASPKKPNAKDFFAGFKSATKGKGKGKETEGTNGTSLKGPTQSLILIEEVDVLYTGEEDFWTGVRALAEESRRPIILTCNDSTLIPFDQLGLQKIHLASTSFDEPLSYLSFSSAQSSIVVPYLQLISLSEGHIVSSGSVRRLYESEESTTREGEESWLSMCKDGKGVRPLPHPFSSEVKKEKDLRRTMMQLQFDLQRGNEESGLKQGEKRWIVGGLEEPKGVEEREGSEKAVQEDWLAEAVLASDSLSFADAQVCRRIETRIEDLDFDACTSSADLELGPPILSPPVPPSHSTQLPYLGREPEVVSFIESLAYSIYPQAIRFSNSDDESNEFKKIPYLNSLALLSTQFFYQPITNTYLPYTPFLPSSPALVIDYLPLYRHLTALDDERERIAEETGEGFGDGGGSGRGAGVRRSTRTTTTGGGGIEVKGKRIKISKLIEWRAKEDVEFVRTSGFNRT